MRRHCAILAAALLLLPAGAARADTLLHLSDSETVSAPPDELDAALRAQATSGSAADAQQQVNAVIADALTHARAVPGITISTGSYFVWHVDPTPQSPSAHWQASQSLDLTSHDAAPLLTLVGTLQHNGMAVEGLTWRLSRAAERAAYATAMSHAITALRDQAEHAASLLGLRFVSFKDVRLGAAAPPPGPRFVGAMMAAAAPAPPSAVPADVTVSATAEADAILAPK